jgi:hypothetical protein
MRLGMLTESFILAEIKHAIPSKSFHGNKSFREHVRTAQAG